MQKTRRQKPRLPGSDARTKHCRPETTVNTDHLRLSVRCSKITLESDNEKPGSNLHRQFGAMVQVVFLNECPLLQHATCATNTVLNSVLGILVLHLLHNNYKNTFIDRRDGFFFSFLVI